MKLVNETIWRIETHLGDDLTLHDLAQQVGVTPYHLSRVFRMRTGWSVMRYVRARRLSRAVPGIAAGQNILTIALDTGYASHEAFTRAFADHFGIVPSHVDDASNLTLTEVLPMTKPDYITLPTPDIRDGGGFTAIGLARNFDPKTIKDIPGLWAEFNNRTHEVDGPMTERNYGICYGAQEDGQFRYLAGNEASPDTAAPKGMDRLSVPQGRYAVFTYTGHLSDMAAFVGAIWDHGLSDAGLTVRNAPDYELYDTRMNPDTGEGTCEIWIPV